MADWRNWKERLDKKLKVGQRLYRIYYTTKIFRSGMDRSIEQHTITEIFRNHVQTFGRGYKIRKTDIGCDYHFTKKQLYRSQLIRQKEAHKELVNDSVKPMEKEIKYLERKCKEYMK